MESESVPFECVKPDDFKCGHACVQGYDHKFGVCPYFRPVGCE